VSTCLCVKHIVERGCCSRQHGSAVSCRVCAGVVVWRAGLWAWGVSTLVVGSCLVCSSLIATLGEWKSAPASAMTPDRRDSLTRDSMPDRLLTLARRWPKKS
jgi:hypothetical protein